MKHLFSFLALLFAISGFSIAQVPYTPFPKDSISWHISGSNEHEENAPTCAFYSLSGKDTVINSKTYTKIIGLNGDKFLGIREENKKIYAYIDGVYQHYSGQEICMEILLYDFNLK